jgi:hypothetical protein
MEEVTAMKIDPDGAGARQLRANAATIIRQD